MNDFAHKNCRCGYDGRGDHPCHANAYSCKKSAKIRFYNPQRVALAGFQLKVQMTDSWACDDCWCKFVAMMESEKNQLRLK